MYNPKNPIRIDKSVEQEYREGGLTDGVSSKITRFDTPTLFD
jgi:hypothetical protein